jgi:hypothetical protein
VRKKVKDAKNASERARRIATDKAQAALKGLQFEIEGYEKTV